MRVRRILKSRHFHRWACGAGLPDPALIGAIAEMAHGLIDGDLGGGIVKKRVRANISPRELDALRKLARDLLSLSEEQIDAQAQSGALKEIR